MKKFSKTVLVLLVLGALAYGAWRWFAGRYNLTLENQNAAAAEAARRSSWYDEGGKPEDPAPGFFKYFTRSRRSTRANTKSAPVVVQPVEVAPGETVTETL